MNRFYFESLEKADDSITIKNPELLNQFNKVLRVKNGDQLAFFNGNDDIDFIFEIKEVQKREVYLEKVGFINVDSEIDFDLNIFNALPNKLDKIEYIVKKGVEVGVTGFYFFRSERSQKLILSPNKIERLKKIIVEAVEQSGRSRIPELIIEDNISLEDFKDNENIIFHTKDDNSSSLKSLNIEYNKGINLFVGPEGGFSSEEIQIFENIGFKRIHLGNRILRTETVGIVTSFFLINNK
ncbi:MAG: RsmE family RNA methyltransferase [Candidatus Gracilibacteria bacterium]